MTPDNSKALSKFLAYVLRHRPDEIGLEPDEQGWVPIDILLQQLAERFPGIDRAQLDYVVATNSKKRFAYDAALQKIRASQGHSIEVQLDYVPMEPPTVLFHGTGQGYLADILEQGLQKKSRHHVHLSQSVMAALEVGRRHGRAVVLKVHSGKMHEAGYTFYISANDVWLTDHVPVEFIEADF